MHAGQVSFLGYLHGLAFVNQTAHPAGIYSGSELGREMNHSNDSSYGSFTNRGIRMREVEMIGRKYLPGGNAGDLKSCVRKSLFHGGDVDFVGPQQRQFDAVVPECGCAIDATLQVVAKDDKCAGQSLTTSHRDSDLHKHSPASKRIVRPWNPGHGTAEGTAGVLDRNSCERNWQGSRSEEHTSELQSLR